MGFFNNIWNGLGDTWRSLTGQGKIGYFDNTPDSVPDPIVPDPIVPDVPLEPGNFITALTSGDWDYITDMFTSMNETLMVIILAVGGLALFMLLRR